jgi:hypothetical protein
MTATAADQHPRNQVERGGGRQIGRGRTERAGRSSSFSSPTRALPTLIPQMFPGATTEFDSANVAWSGQLSRPGW